MTTSKRSTQSPSPDSDPEKRLIGLLHARKGQWERSRPELFHRTRMSHGKVPNPFSSKPVPLRSLPDAFPAGVSDRKLDAFTRRTGVELPSSLRRWLKITNGAAGFFGVRTRRKEDDIEQEWEKWADMKERGWIPVAYDDFGNRYVQLFPDRAAGVEPVCYVETIGGYISHVVASDMLRFALFKLEDALGVHESLAKSTQTEAFMPRSKLRKGAPDIALAPWPFSKKYMLARDPNLKLVQGLPMPWKR